MAQLTPIIKESFLQFGGAVLQSRALVDVRDCIKPSARQVFYCMYTDKFIHFKPFQKTLKAIGSAFRLYIHGDSSVEGIIMRASQPFAMRYPLIEVEGSCGTLLSSGSWAAPRYTSSRLSSLAEYLFKDLDKETITDWRDNYDETEKYPSVLPSKGFFNLVNGCYGIGVGASASIPTYNLRELNEALIKLLWNPNIDFEEIYCAPDFPTGTILLNADEVKESHKFGTGKACKLRSKVEYDEKENCLIVTEIPYMVYTDTICTQLEEIINSENNYGIERFNDLTGKDPLIKIYLSKRANPQRVLKFLFKNTSLEYYYGINFTMLDQGRFPKVFTWKEILQAHLDHEEKVYINGFNFDLKRIKNRLSIIEALLKAINQIEEVIKIIKNSSTVSIASNTLQEFLNINENQAKAILEIKLSRLANLEVNKLIKEQENLLENKRHIEAILADKNLLKKEIEKGLQEVADKFGDERRTQILNLKFNEEDDEPIEEKALIVHLTNFGNLYTFESTTLMTQKRGGKGIKVKMDNNEYIIDTISDSNTNNCLIFSNKGKAYTINLNDLPINQKVNVNTLFEFETGEQITNIIPFNKINNRNYMIFVTKNGLIKKSSLEEYRIKKSKGVIAVKIKEGDTLKRVMLVDSAPIGILTKAGNYLIIDTEKISPTGRATSGVIGIKLSKNDEVVDAKIIPPSTKEIVSISSSGMIKRTDYNSFSIGNRSTKGSSIQKLKDNDTMISFNVIDEKDDEIAIVSNKAIIKILLKEIQLSSKGAQGTQAKKTETGEKIIEILKIKER